MVALLSHIKTDNNDLNNQSNKLQEDDTCQIKHQLKWSKISSENIIEKRERQVADTLHCDTWVHCVTRLVY